jgi:hypothetical protein
VSPDTGDDVMIGRFIIGPIGSGQPRLIVRAIAPSLVNADLTGALGDPLLEIHDINGTVIAANDDWKETQQAAIEAANLAPSHERESAIASTPGPGPYTAMASGKASTSGVGLVEVFVLE